MYIPNPACLVQACIFGLLAACTLGSSLLAGPPVKNPKDVVVEAHPMYLGTITGGVKTSDVYTEGNFSIVAPVWSTLGVDATLSGDVIYLEPYTSWGEGGEVAASLGIGWRHLFGNQSVSVLKQTDAPQPGFFDEGVFVGANLFVDMLDTEADNQFWQLGVGLEVGTRYVEVRGNYYIPLSDKQLAEETRTVDTIQRSGTSTSQSVAPTSDPYATGNSIAQDALFTTTATTTISTTTIERLFRRYEEGMEGWDAELALLIPGLDRYFDLRVIGGYYKFDNQPFGPQEGGTGNVEGWKAGVEIRPVPAVILTGTWYEDERLTGSDWTLGVQLQMPFEAGDLGDGKGFWDRIGDSFTPRRRHLVERLAEPVHRQNAAIKVANTVDTETNTDTRVKRVTRVVSQRPGRVVLEDDIVFVNNGGPVGNGIQEGDEQVNGATGTAEQPFNTITEGAVVAGANSNTTGRLWSVYTQGGTGLEYEDYVFVTGNTRFTSSYVPVVGLGGRNFGGDTPRPVLYGGFDAFEINTLIVQGYDIRDGLDGFGPGVAAFNPGNLIVEYNQFSNTEFPSVYVIIENEVSSIHNLAIHNNEFYDSAAAMFLETLGPESDDELLEVNLSVRNNMITSTIPETDGFVTIADGRTLLNAIFDGNAFEGDFIGAFYAETYYESVMNATYSNNTFGGLFDDSVTEINSFDSSIVMANFIGNKLAPGTEYEDGFDFESYDFSTFTVLVQSNTFLGDNSDSMVEFVAEDDSILNGTVRDNHFGGQNFDEAVDLESFNRAHLTVLVTDNRFPGEFGQALDAEQSNRSMLDLTFTNNTLNGYFDEYAIELSGFDGPGSEPYLRALIQNNDFNGLFSQGAIYGEKLDHTLVDITIDMNRFDALFNNSAIRMEAYGDEGPNNRLIATISNNQFRGMYSAEAINLFAAEDAKLDTFITGNFFQGDFDGEAITMVTEDVSRIVATISDNRLRSVATVGGAFLRAVSLDDSRLKIENFDRNLLRGAVDVGFIFDEQSSSVLTVDGTLNPAATNEVVNFATDILQIPSNDPAGSFFLNDVQVDLP